MMEVVWLKESTEDLKEIGRYIAKEANPHFSCHARIKKMARHILKPAMMLSLD